MANEKHGADIEHISGENNGNFDRSWRDEMWGDRKLSIAAEETSKDEKDLSIWESIKASKKAIMWSLIISTCVIMEGTSCQLVLRLVLFAHSTRPSLSNIIAFMTDITDNPSFRLRYKFTRQLLCISLLPEKVWQPSSSYPSNSYWLFHPT